MMKAIVTEVGINAIGKEELVILFDETATVALREYSVIQEFVTTTEFELSEGGTIVFDEQIYSIQHVGRTANHNLQAIGHVALVFGETPETDAIVNGIYLSPYQVPEIRIGTKIKYQ